MFDKHAVEYLIVGGYALAFHGAPRFTGHMDIFVAPDRKNAEPIISTLDEFGFGNCRNETECEAECPKEISITNIARLNREFLKAGFLSSEE